MKTKMTEMELAANGLPTNLHNPWQGAYKRVLCVCTGGILRSATAAEILSGEPYNYNTRCAGITDLWSLIPVSQRLLEWADEIVCFESWHLLQLQSMTDKPIHCLGIEDAYAFRDPTLVRLIKERVKKEFA
jgi:predicted protein tyrosine phosphatase